MLTAPKFVTPGQEVTLHCSGRLGKNGTTQQKNGRVIVQIKSEVILLLNLIYGIQL